MIFTKTRIEGVLVVDPEPRIDERGYFQRMYCVNEFADQGIDFKIVQANQAMSLKRGTIRGPHMQKAPNSEDKLMQCTKGAIFDVAIDFRKESPTFGQWVGNTISEENKKMVFVPKGIMHGYQVLEDNTVVQYPVSQFYSPDDVIGIRWDDPFFKIEWPIKDAITSKIDKGWPLFSFGQ